jgi:hypothetical protein
VKAGMPVGVYIDKSEDLFPMGPVRFTRIFMRERNLCRVRAFVVAVKPYPLSVSIKTDH